MEIGTYPLEKTSIFQGADAQQVQKMLGVILPSIKTYARGETICRAGETVSSLGIVLAGGATIELCDAWGNRSIIERLEPGEVFAEAYACLPGEPLMVSVTADAPTRVMFLGVSRMLSMGLNRSRRS
ncbi:MAG: cyclic nucleotide-binding domain-containing protein [Christensenellales bacterium]